MNYEECFEAQWNALREEGCITENDGWVRLSDCGRRISSAIADIFTSDRIRAAIAGHSSRVGPGDTAQRLTFSMELENGRIG